MKFEKNNLGLHLIYWGSTILLIFFSYLAIRALLNWGEYLDYLFNSYATSKATQILKAVNITIGIINIILVIIAFVPLYLFRKFIGNTKNGQVFTLANIKLLKRLTLILIIYCILAIGNKIVMWEYILKQQGFVSDRLFLLDSFLIFFAIFLWVLTYVFKAGFNLQREKDLTI